MNTKIDKVDFGNLKDIDFSDFFAFDRLKRKGIIENNVNAVVRYRSTKGFDFTRLQVDDNRLFDKLTVATKLNGNRMSIPSTLSISINDDKHSNLYCYSVSDYVNRVEQIEKSLKFEYGIIVDLTEVEVKRIEINRTFAIDGKFNDYYRVFKLIMANLPSRLQNQSMYLTNGRKEIEAETFYATSKISNKSKKYLELKIYDKRKQLEKKIILMDDIARFEFTIVGKEKIKTAFGTNLFMGLNDEIIDFWFKSQIQKLIIKPYEEWKKIRDRYLIDLMRSQREENEKYWIVNTLRILMTEEVAQKKPVILDVEEILNLVGEIEPDRKKSTKLSVRSGIKRRNTKASFVIVMMKK